MAKNTTVTRDGKGEAFTLPDTQNNLDPDIAIVGDTSDGVDIDGDSTPEEREWDAPPNGRARPNQRDEIQDTKSGEFDEEDSRLAYSDDPREQQDEDQNQRPGRRSRRNARRRESQSAAQSQIADLHKQLTELHGVVKSLATGQSGLAANTLEGQITSLENALRMADEEMASAVKNSDGDTYSKAQNIRDNIVGRLWSLKNQHSQLMDTRRNQREQNNGAGGQVDQSNGQAQERQVPQVDPRIVEAVEDRFDRFCDRFPWFDSQSPNADCNIVRSIDAELAAQGYQRHTPHFWQQMERRMAQYGLHPEREEDDGNNNQNDIPRRQQQRQPMTNGRSRPPTGSGRSTQSGRSSANNSLDATQVSLLRDEGLLEDKLDDEQIARRDRIIAKWRNGAKSLNRQGAR